LFIKQFHKNVADENTRTYEQDQQGWPKTRASVLVYSIHKLK